MTRHFGGSLLPSGDPRILTVQDCAFGKLQVRVLSELDAYGLFLKVDGRETMLAQHPNGYSCRELADRMIKGNEKQVREQAQYILDCGGLARNIEHIVNAMKAA
jgi:hypothetical protein